MSFVTKENTEDIYPLSPTQKGMLFHSILDETSPVYFQQLSFRIKGPLDVTAFRKAWAHVIGLTPVFRTVFKWAKVKEPLQIVLKHLPVDLVVHDITGAEEAGQARLIEDFRAQDRTRPFNLEEGPLMRLNLFQIGHDIHHFVWSHHHIIIDGWCLPIILRDLFDAYLSALAGKPLPHPARRPYRDYIAWYLQQDNDRARAFWEDRLGDLMAPTPLPYDRRPGTIKTPEVGDKEVCLSEDLSVALTELARRERITLSTLMQAAWAVLLSRYSNQDDVCFGVTVSGRPADLKGAEDMVGLFINTLPLRVKCGPGLRASDLLQDVQRLSQAMREYEYSFLPDVKAASAVPKDQPLFESIFVFENYPIESAASVQDAAFGISHFQGFEMTNFPLALVVAPGQQVRLIMHYYLTLFHPETITRMLGHLEQVLTVMVESPQVEIDRIDILTPAEREALLVTFNDTVAPYPAERCIQELIEDQVDRSPDRTALRMGESCLSYRELEAKANQLAHHLRDKGIGPGKTVGVFIDRSFEMIIAVLGIIKAGGAYVPIETEYPKARIEYMLADCGADLILAQSAVIDSLPPYGGEVICLDRDWDTIGRHPVDRPALINSSRDLVYVIYTSGSTGNPKGIEIEHRGLINYITWAVSYYDVPGHGAFPLYTSMSFDLTVTSMFVPLVTGESITIMPVGLDPTRLVEQVLGSGCDIAKLTPAHLEIADTLTAEGTLKSPNLMRMILGGEALSAKVSRSMQARYPGLTIYNEYGPAETVVGCIVYPFTTLPTEYTHVPIGKPIANTTVYILDRHRRLVPMGVTGEIYISSPGVARGYLNKAEATERSFVPNPFRPGDRIYRTGDLGRWMPDGNIEYQGRVDHQVKIRGFRIELGEIEAVLLRYEGIHECVVVDRPDAAGGKYLVAYFVAEGEVSMGALKAFLREALPEYMVPTRFMRLEVLPLTPNGKVDRDGLPEADTVASENTYVAPVGALEETLCQVWQEVLAVERVGVNDNFFDLGGHSILIMKVLARLKLSYPLTVQDFFDHQTVAELARIAQERMCSGGAEGPAPVEIEAQTTLTVDIPISGAKETYNAILLTGVTGYLGAHLLYELLERTPARIYCLIRARNEAQARERLIAALDFSFSGEPLDLARVTPVCGDIAVDGLGLEAPMRKLLADVDAIVHAAADVRHFGEYAKFRNTNVLGTSRLLDLAQAGGCRRFHYISTLSVSGEYIPPMAQAVFKETDYDRGQVLENVYARTKFEAEACVREAAGDALAVSIYRVGNLVGASTTGRFQRSIDTSAFYGLLKAIIQMGAVPAGLAGSIDMTPIDSCRQALGELILMPETQGRCLHVFNPHLVTYDGLVDRLRAVGYPIDSLELDQYLERIQGGTGRTETDEALEKLIPKIAASAAPKTIITYDASVAQHLLDAVGFVWPVIDTALIQRLTAYCAAVGFLNPPSA